MFWKLGDRYEIQDNRKDFLTCCKYVDKKNIVIKLLGSFWSL